MAVGWTPELKALLDAVTQRASVAPGDFSLDLGTVRGLGGGLVAWGVVGGGVGVVSGLFGGQRYYAPVASYR